MPGAGCGNGFVDYIVSSDHSLEMFLNNSFQCTEQYNMFFLEDDVLFTMAQLYSENKNSSFPSRSQTCDLPITSSNALSSITEL